MRVLIALVAATGTAIASPPVPNAPKAGPVRHIQLKGDLDAEVLKDMLAGELANSAKDGSALVILELNGDSWRADVTADLCSVVMNSPVPVVSLLHDGRDKRVGLGQYILGLAGRACFVSPSTVIRGGSADAIRDGSSDTTDWSEVDRRLARTAEEGLDNSGAAAAVEDLVVGLVRDSLSMPAFVSVDASTVTLVVDGQPAGGRRTEIVSRTPDGHARLAVSGEFAAKLAMAKPAGGVAAVASAMGLREATRHSVTIESGLARARERAGELVADCDAAIARVDSTLSLPTGRDTSIAPSKYAEASRRARDEIAKARELLVSCEALTERYPELLRGPAPGQTTVGADGQNHVYKWRSTVQIRRDKLDRAEAKARLFESP